MLMPSEYDQLTDQLMHLYWELDDAIIADITRRLMSTGGDFLTESARHQAEKLQQSGLLYEDIIAEVAKRSGMTQRQVAKTFERAGVQSIRNDNRYYQAGLGTIVKMSDSALQVLNAGYQKCNGNLQNLTLTTANTAQTAFLQACDLAYMEVSTGTMDYQTAVRRAIQATAEQGATVLYPSGHVDKLDVAVRRAVLTGVGQTVRKLSEINAHDMGCDLMEITAHAGARPSHAQWQGQIVSLSGRKGYLSKSDIGYGEVTGFGGVNCRHDWHPFFEGISQRAYSDERLQELENHRIKIGDKSYTDYEVSQMQRRLEREVRSAKRQVIASQTAVSSATDSATRQAMQDYFTESSVRLKQAEKNLRDFCNQTGFRRDSSRVWVNGFGRSISQKAVHANKKALTNGGGSGTIESSKGLFNSTQSSSFIPATDVSDAETYARDVLGIPNVSYQGVSVEIANEWNKGLYETFEKFPELRKQFGFVGTCQERNRMLETVVRQGITEQLLANNPTFTKEELTPFIEAQVQQHLNKLPISPDALAQSYSPALEICASMRGISINADKCQDIETLKNQLKMDVERKFRPLGCDSIRGLLDHEIGHQLDKLLGIRELLEIQVIFDSYSNSQIEEGLSRYAWNNGNPNKYAEAIAEAWAEYCNNPEPRQIAEAVGKIIEKAYREKFNND